MTPEQAKVLLAWVPYIEAVRDGKTVQTREHSIAPWQNIDIDIAMENSLDTDTPLNQPLLWRVKPEPREWWIQPIRQGKNPAYAYESIKEANTRCDGGSAVCIHVREVLPE